MVERSIFNKWLGCGRGSMWWKGVFLCLQPVGAQPWGIQSSKDNPLQAEPGCWLSSSWSCSSAEPAWSQCLFTHTWFCCVLLTTHEYLLCFQRKRYFPPAEAKSVDDKTRQNEEILKCPAHLHTCRNH